MLSDIVQTSQNFWLFGAGLTAPIFNAGRIRANIRVAWAQYEQLALQYENTVLMAFRDVEAALVNYGKLKERHASLTAAQASAHDRVQIQELRYLRGTGDYLGLLDARGNLVLSEIGLTESRRSLADARLAVHRSLGGTWIQEGSELDLDAARRYCRFHGQTYTVVTKRGGCVTISISGAEDIISDSGSRLKARDLLTHPLNTCLSHPRSVLPRSENRMRP